MEPGETQDSVPQEPAAEEGASDAEGGVGTFLYRMALAGVGALVLAQEEIEERLRKLRGAGEGGAAGEAAAAEEGAEAGDAAPRRTLAEHIDGTVSRVLHTLHVPTRTEVEELTRRVEEISRRIESLRR